MRKALSIQKTFVVGKSIGFTYVLLPLTEEELNYIHNTRDDKTTKYTICKYSFLQDDIVLIDEHNIEELDNRDNAKLNKVFDRERHPFSHIPLNFNFNDCTGECTDTGYIRWQECSDNQQVYNYYLSRIGNPKQAMVIRISTRHPRK